MIIPKDPWPPRRSIPIKMIKGNYVSLDPLHRAEKVIEVIDYISIPEHEHILEVCRISKEIEVHNEYATYFNNCRDNFWWKNVLERVSDLRKKLEELESR